MPIMVKRNKWILYKHTSNYELIKAVALDVKNSCRADISATERFRMQERLAVLDLYKTRNPSERPLDSINHRINTLEFWMFGYETKINGINRFMFSPLGNLFLKYINDKSKIRKIFISMLFAVQFEHPASSTNSEFQLYPFRLIFKLLTDPRIEKVLYHYEVEYILMFENNLTFESYNIIIEKIIEMRKYSNEQLEVLFKQDEHTYVNCVYEWEYYTVTLFNQAELIDKYDGEFITKLFHPTKTNSKSLPTGRTATRGFIKLKPEVEEFINKMLTENSVFEVPISLNEIDRLQIDIIKEIYSFYPKALLSEIRENDSLTDLLELPKLIELYSNNPENDTAYLFENVLVHGFNLFYNVDARARGGAGHTDIECLYTSKKLKFAVESKSTSNKLLGINAGRLREHREEIGGKYTIVVTPRYVPATTRDIKDTPIVIILASTFAEYLYNNIFHDVRNIDYEDIHDIAEANLGKDISELISLMTFEKFSAIS